MGAPMAGHLIKGGHRVHLVAAARACRRSSSTQAAIRLREREGGRAEGRRSSSPWCRTRRTSRRCCSAQDGVAAGLAKGKIVVDMSSISPIATKDFAKKINALGLRLPRRAGLRRRSRRQGGVADHHGRRHRGRVRARQAAVRADGQEHHAGRRQRRRPDDQGRQPDHRRADHRGGRRGAAVRLEGRRRSGEGAPGADGRLRVVADPRSARRAHDQAHLRPGLPHRAAPEGPEPRAVDRRALGVALPNTATAQELFNACAAHGGAALDHSALVRALERLGQLRDRREAGRAR